MPYRTSVRGLFDALASSRTVTDDVEIADVALGGQSYHFEGPASFEIDLTNAGAGIVAGGVVRATVLTPCSRCLCDARLSVEAEVDAFYVLPGREEDLPEEQEAELIADDMTVDLEPSVAAALVVELPFAPLHDEHCKGICPVCGADRNTDACDCVVTAEDSRFAALRELKVDE